MKHLVSPFVQRRSLWFTAASLASSLLLSACGGKSSDPPSAQTGQFLDGPVEGLRYATATQSGTTNASGEFKYLPGESVTFSIGGMNLPSVPAAAVLTPVDVAGTQDLNDAKLTNLLVLLQSLDQDGNTANGIRIPAAAATAVTGASAMALAQALQTASATAFSGGTALRTVLDATVGSQRAVVAAADAVDHFAQTLATARPTTAFVTRSSVVKTDPQAADLGFDRPVRLRFEGLKLASAITATAQGACSTMTTTGSPTETAVEFTCTPTTTGPLTVSVMNGNRTLHTYTGTVPEPQVKLVTSLGELTLELNVAKAPVTSKNFLRYVADGYYAGTVFHRVISNFMVQAGGFQISGSNLAAKGGTYDPIVLERTTTTGLSNVTGTVAMARTNVENSATSQFFINVVDNLSLNATNSTPGYAVFGRVVEGADTTLQSVRSVEVRNNGAGEVSLPASPPSIVSATRIR
jgi:peptidyl-prolyl cis-trans isomerase A (cyclophilin A)